MEVIYLSPYCCLHVNYYNQYYSYLIKVELLNIHKRIRFIYLPQKSFQKIVNVVKKLQTVLRRRREDRLFRAAFTVFLFLKMKNLRKRFLKIRAALPILDKAKSIYRARYQRKKYLATIKGIINNKCFYYYPYDYHNYHHSDK